MKRNRNLTSVVILLVLIVITVAGFWLNDWFKHQQDFHKVQLKQQAELIESNKKSGYVHLLSNMLDLLDDEVKDNPTLTLSDETISRISSLCYFLKPYASSQSDSLPGKLLSPERGQLLLVLSKMNLDTITLSKIRKQATFAGADLREADLSGTNLSDIDLHEADLYGADLHGAVLIGADMSFANLWGANLGGATLREANLKRAVISWSDLNGADMRKADLHEADLRSAQLRMADLRGANLRWTDLTGAFLNEAKLDSADMFRAVLKKAQLFKTNMQNANLNNAILSEANVTEANLIGTNLLDVVLSDKHWIEHLPEWKVTGAMDIQNHYSVVEGVSYEQSKYKLIRLGN